MRILMIAGAVIVMLLSEVIASQADDCSEDFNVITSWISQKHDFAGTCLMENIPIDGKYPANAIPYKLRNGKEICPRNRYETDMEYLWKNGQRISGIHYLGSKAYMTLAFKESFIPDGPVRIYHNEKLFCEVPVNRDGKPDGIISEYTPEGKLSNGFRMVGGKREGGFVKFNKAGKLESFACESKPVFDGDPERCGFNGRPATVKLPDGRVITHIKGKLTVEEVVRSDGTRFVTTYPDTGKQMVLFAEYYKNGRLLRSSSKRGGQLDGTFREFYDDGTPAEVGIAEQGRIVELKRFFKNGKPKLKARLIKDGELCEARIFTQDGKPEKEGTFKSYRKSVAWDVPHGMVRNYGFDGLLTDKGNYINGSRDGRHTFYLKKGLKKEIDYVNGSPTRLREFDKKGGFVKEFIIYADGSKKEITRR